MAKANRLALGIDHTAQREPFLTAAFEGNKHHQRPADRSRGVPRHLSAPPRLAGSPRCAKGCVAGRRVGLVAQSRMSHFEGGWLAPAT